MDFATPDLTQNPPRSPRTKLGGYVMLPRLIDKCRGQIAGKNGEYHYGCPLDNGGQRYRKMARGIAVPHGSPGALPCVGFSRVG